MTINSVYDYQHRAIMIAYNHKQVKHILFTTINIVQTPQNERRRVYVL